MQRTGTVECVGDVEPKFPLSTPPDDTDVEATQRICYFCQPPGDDLELS